MTTKAQWIDYAATLETERAAQAREIAALREALTKIAGQPLDAELEDDGAFGSHYDFVEGYDTLIKEARAGLAGSPPPDPAEATRALLQRVSDWDEDEPLGGSQLLDSIRAALKGNGEGK